MGEITKSTDNSKVGDDEISLVDLLSTVLRHTKMILIVTFGAALLCLIYVIGSLLLAPEMSYLPNMYKPTATILINSQDSGGGLSSMLASSGLSGMAGLAGISTGGTNYGLLAASIAKSNTILDALVDKFGLIKRYKIKKSPKASSRKALLKHYTVANGEKTGTMTISFEDRDPELAKDLVNFAVELLDKRFTVIGGNRNGTKKDQLELKLADVQSEMMSLEAEIQAFQLKHGIITIDSIAKEQVATVAQVRSALIMKEMEIKTYGDISKVQDPALMRLNAERGNLSKLLDELEKGFATYENVLPSQRELPRLAIDFSHLQRNLMIQQKIFELLTQQYELTKLQIQGADPILQILEAAEAPDMKSSPSRASIVLVAIFAAFFASILGAFIFEGVQNIRSDPEAMAKLRGIAK